MATVKTIHSLAAVSHIQWSRRFVLAVGGIAATSAFRSSCSRCRPFGSAITTTRTYCTSDMSGVGGSGDNISSKMPLSTGYLSAVDAAALDKDLMTLPGFTLEQLMELAGLSVAEAVYACLPDNSSTVVQSSKNKKGKILIVCGPGNNGGDGLVAARHLRHFGCSVTVVYPKRSSKRQHYANLVQQCDDLGIPVKSKMPDDWKDCDVVVDAIFGFSFSGNPRPPFDSIIDEIKEWADRDSTLTVAVDVPSGWGVDGDTDKSNRFEPDVLISLTAPKLCAKSFRGRHFVGGRFLPPDLAAKYAIRMPTYVGVSQVYEVTSSVDTQKDEENWEAGYAAYCAEKENKERKLGLAQQVNKEHGWEAEYAAYCAETEGDSIIEQTQS